MSSINTPVVVKPGNAAKIRSGRRSAARLVRRNLVATKLRLVLTALSIVLGVSFVTSSFVLADGLRKSFKVLSASINDGTDLSLRSVDGLGEALPISDTLIAKVQAIPGVAAAVGQLTTDGVQPVKANGDPVTVQGPPQFGFAWVPDKKLNAFTVIKGREPRSGAEFTIDLASAKNNDLLLGNSYDVLTPTGRYNAKLVGLVRFGPENATLGATLTQFPLTTAQTWFGLPGQVRVVEIRVKGANKLETIQAVKAAIERFAPSGTEVVNQRTLTKETEDGYITNVDLIGNVLLGFAIVSLFVSSFIIANTFAIVVGQRTRELALLRALGGSREQVRGMVLGEAAIVGFGASLVGIGVGVLVTLGLRAAFGALGLSLPDADPVVSPRTWAIGVTLGLGVTVLAAIRPALRASRVAPVTAMSTNVAGAESHVSIRSAGVGIGIAGLGAALVGLGQLSTGSIELAAVGTGVILVLVGVLRLAPYLVQPVLSVLGAPIRRALGHSGKLAQTNAMRNPRRTANTGAALMIGLALVAGALVIGQSIKDHFAKTVATGIAADVLITPKGNVGVPLVLAAEMQATGGFTTIGDVRQGEIQLNGNTTTVSGVAASSWSGLFKLDLANGEAPYGPNAIALTVEEAKRLGVGVGASIVVKFPIGTQRRLVVSGLYQPSALLRDALLDTSSWAQVAKVSTVDVIAGRFSPLVTPVQRTQAITALRAALVQVNVETAAQFTERISAQIDQLLVIINLMMVLTIIIALLGITNTLALAVIERTRELGLLRAVGMSRRAIRRIVRWEAALIATFGAVLGAVLGIVLGWVGVRALPNGIATGINIPFASLGVLTLGAVVAAIVAAQIPARRASRLDVLKAISL
jgi:putative ABC transport system permease protein